MTNELTLTESGNLEILEGVIQSGLKTFADVGNALLEIRDNRLYRVGFKTFEEYCKERWCIGSSRARQLISAAKIVSNVESVTIVTPPATESQARPLAKLPPAQQPEAWTAANEKAESEGRKVTARDVHEVVEEILPKEKPQPKYKPSNGLMYSGMAISSLSKIQKDDTEKKEALQKVVEWINKNK